MIDFRYYLVSIVSIFLALAVGIVLGAGPLKGDLGARLTEQLTALRAEKTQLRTDLDTARRDASSRDTFSSAVAPAVVSGRLTGKTVAIVVAPGVDADLVKKTTASLISAGANVGSTITLTDSWADPSQATKRNTIASPFASLVKAPGEASSPDQLAAGVLARAILAGTDHSTERLTAAAGAALNGLKDGDLITYSPDQIVPSSSVVFLGGQVKAATQEETDARLASYVQLSRLLDAAGSGVVVAARSNSADSAKSADLVAGVRKDSEAVKGISTVDDADLPMGLGTIVMALRQQYTGGAGQYGLASDAKAILPDLAARQ
ncbi:MAG: copper transporter [Actinomycetota bacterium]